MTRIGPDGRLHCWSWPRFDRVVEIVEKIALEDPELYERVQKLEAELHAQFVARTGTGKP